MCRPFATAPPEPLRLIDTITATLQRQPLASIRLPGLPPTVNHSYRTRPHGPGLYMTADCKGWMRDVIPLILLAYRKRAPLAGKVAILTCFAVRDRKRWDLDNRKKALWDALTHAGVWADDSQVDMSMTVRVLDRSLNEPETRIWIWELEPAEGIASKPRKKRATAVRPRREAVLA